MDFTQTVIQGSMITPVNTQRANTVEIIGAPGVGKSTFYNAFCRTWNTKRKWTYPAVLLAEKRSKSNLFPSAYYLARFFKKTQKTVGVDYGLRFVQHHQELCAFLWKYISDSQTYSSSELDKKFRSVYFLFKDFSNYQAILESNSRLPCILDEGLLTKSFLMNHELSEMEALIDHYLTLLPLPVSVVYLYSNNTSVIVDRLLNRKKVIASHQNKNAVAIAKDVERWQAYFEIVTKKLRQYNVPVHTVDGLKPVAEKIEIVSRLLQNIK